MKRSTVSIETVARNREHLQHAKCSEEQNGGAACVEAEACLSVRSQEEVGGRSV